MASVFSKILNKELPGHFVWRDPHCFAIMTNQPIRDGHLLVIPREEVNHWDDVPAELAAHLMIVAQKIAKGMKEVIASKRIGVSVVGLEVHHTHIHLIPIDNLGDMNFGHATPVPAERLADMARRIREALRRQGHAEADLDRQD